MIVIPNYNAEFATPDELFNGCKDNVNALAALCDYIFTLPIPAVEVPVPTPS